MYTAKNDTQNDPFCRLKLVVQMFGYSTQWNELSNQNSIKVFKVVEPTYKKTLYKNLGTSVINQE